MADVADPSHTEAWPPLLFLTDVYTQSLLTMGDDEFFVSASSVTAASTTAPRNPLTLEELTVLSRKLLNIAFNLYWREDQTNVQEGGVPGVNLKWERVREKVTKCLQAIHAREYVLFPLLSDIVSYKLWNSSRRQFTPPDHWHVVSSQVDMSTFIEAAVYVFFPFPFLSNLFILTLVLPFRFEEQQLAQPTGQRPLSKRQVAYLSPRLCILNNIPFCIPFERRVSIFRSFVATDMISRGGLDHHSRVSGRRIWVSVWRETGSIRSRASFKPRCPKLLCKELQWEFCISCKICRVAHDIQTGVHKIYVQKEHTRLHSSLAHEEKKASR